MEKMILSILCVITPLLIISQTPIPAGPVSGTWDLTGSPYMINGEIYIEDASTLTIEPGVEVKFTGWFKFIVNGSLLAEGTENANISFTSSSLGVNWRGIQILEADKTIILDHCIVEYGKTYLTGGGTPDNSGGGICCYNSPDASITIKNSIIRYNQAWFGGGISCDNTNIQIENCEITNNNGEMGGGLYFRLCNTVLSDCKIANNNANEDGGGMLCDTACAIELYRNRIIYNISGFHAGGFDCVDASGFHAENNLFAHNESRYGGAGSFYFTTGAVLKNNTWANNKGLNRGGAIYFWQGTSTHTNDIFYFNEAGQGANPNQCYLGPNCHPDFIHCNIQDSIDGFSGDTISWTGSLVNCICSDPLFVDTLYDYNITWENYPVPDSTMSPCIDSGDPASGSDPDGTCCDIGAYCFFQGVDIPEILPPISISHTSFIAMWEQSYGALYYLLDVAEDYAFTNFVIEDETVYDTEYLLEGLEYGQEYFYRVRGANNAAVSDYSDIMGNPVSVQEDEISNPLVYSSHGTIYIVGDQLQHSSEVRIFDLSGKLLMQQGLNPGSNVIECRVRDQVVIISIIDNGSVYSQKLLVY
jgi:hypothetical protein